MSNLLNRSTVLPVYREPGGMKYAYMEEYTKTLMDMFWKFDSVELGKDVEDYNRASKEEKKHIDDTMKLFIIVCLQRLSILTLVCIQTS